MTSSIRLWTSLIRNWLLISSCSSADSATWSMISPLADVNLGSMNC